MSLDDIVKVVITAETRAPTRIGFGTPLVMSYHTVFPERARIYTDTADMITDGFPSNHPAVRCVGSLLAQNPKVSRVVVGREENSEKQLIEVTPVSPPTASFDYIVYVNGKEAKYTSDDTPTVAEITAGLKSAIDLLGENVTVVDNSTDFTIEANTVDDAFGFYTDSTCRTKFVTENTTPDGSPDGIVADITAVRETNDEWYSLHLTNMSKPIVLAAAAYIETLIKIFPTSSADDDCYNSGITTDVISALKTGNYDRTAIQSHPKAIEQYPSAGWAGVCLPQDPGSITWKFKAPSAVDVVDFTETEISALRGKNGNFYSTVSGLSIMQDGKMASGEWIDTIRGLDFVQARLQEYIFARLANAKKIPFTDRGVAIVVNEIWAVIRLAIRQGIFAETPEPTVTAPLVADVSSTDKANRLLPDIYFTATLAGAIHAVEVEGRVSV